MSDSDDELLSNSAFTFRNDGSTMWSARGPDINIKNMTFRNNFGPRTLEPIRYAETNYERQRNMRGISPMSVTSACDARFRAFNNSHYPRAISSQGSIYNGRSASPAKSTRTCDTNTTVTATDIAQALINPNFNKMEARIIYKAFNKFKAMDRMRRLQKRQKQRRFLERNRRLSYDSGDQASLSSSSDDNRSTKTTAYRNNMSSCRSTKTDISGFRRTIQDTNIYKDNSNNFRQNYSRNFPNRPASNSTLISMTSAKNMTNNIQEPRNRNVFVFGNRSNFQTQKERFQTGYVLPSQRFDKSIAMSTIQEPQRRYMEDTDSDDNIFPVNNNKSKALPSRKRSVYEENALLPHNKRPRVASPCKNGTEARKAKEMDNANMLTKSNDFVFAKPSFPIKKNVKEKLISQSVPRLPDIVASDVTGKPPLNKKNAKPTLPIQNTVKVKIISQSAPPLPDIVESDLTEKQPNKRIANDNEEISPNFTQSTDVSLRPSFIKRKLFTQKLDVAENKNISSDNLVANSPQGSIYGAIQKEKHKARKLVTNQSCLNREITDDNNLLELIHKIVPANSMNITTQSNKTQVQSTKNKSNTKISDKWDVSSIISTNINEDDCSDTYTDEDIFNGDNNGTVNKVPSDKNTKSKLQKNNKNIPSLERAPSNDKLLVSEKMPSKGKNPVLEKLTSKEKLPITEKNISKPVSEEVTRKDKLAFTEKVTSKGKHPISQNGIGKDQLPNSEDPLPVFRKPEVVSTQKSHGSACKVMVHKMPVGMLNGTGVKNCIKSFWDTDSESDVENLTTKRNNIRKNNYDYTKPQNNIATQLQGVETLSNKPIAHVDASLLSIADTTLRLNGKNFTIRSHRSLKPKKGCDDNKENTIISYFEPLDKKKKSEEQILADNKKCDDNIEKQDKYINVTKKPREIKQTATRILKTPPKAKQTRKNIEQTNTDQPREQKEPSKRQAQAKARAKKQETPKAQAKKQETTKAQAKKLETIETQAKKQETIETPAKKQETKKAQSKKLETIETQAKKQETIETPAKKQETKKAQSKKLETIDTHAKKQETTKAQAKEQETTKAQTKKQETTKAKAKKQETIETQAKDQEIAKTQGKKPETAKENIYQDNKIETTPSKKTETKTAKVKKTPPKSKSKQNVAAKTQANSKDKRNKKILLENLTNSTFENDISKITRPKRSCRLDSTPNSSGSFNLSMTLRPRKTLLRLR